MHNPKFASSWIGRLRWDPRLLNYEMAQYNRMKMMGPRCIWEGQPVDPYVPFPLPLRLLPPRPLPSSSFHDASLCLVVGLAKTSRLQSFKRDLAHDPQRGDTRKVEIVIRPPPLERVEVLEGKLVSPPLSIH
jgi:hypothetical protein